MKLCASSQFPFVCLGDCGEVVTGSTPPKANSDFWGGEIPFVTPAQLGFQQPITTADEYVTREGADRGRLLLEGAVLVCCIGSLGKTGIAGVPLISNQQINAIIFDPVQVDARYGYHAARNLTPLLKHFAPSTTVKIVKKSTFTEFQIPLPPLPEQRRIAEILDKADALRAKRRAALAQLDTLTQSIFIDMFGDPATNPKGWPVRTIRDFLESASYGTSEKAEATGEFPVLRMSNITRTGEMDFAELKYMDLKEDQHERYLVRTGDVLFNRTNSAELVGKTAIYREANPMAYAGYLIRLRVNRKYEPEYLAAFLNTVYSKRVLRSMCKSIIGMANINATELQALRIPVPPHPVQHEFAGCIAAVEKLKATHRISLIEQDDLFTTVQQHAFRGDL